MKLPDKMRQALGLRSDKIEGLALSQQVELLLSEGRAAEALHLLARAKPFDESAMQLKRRFDLVTGLYESGDIGHDAYQIEMNRVHLALQNMIEADRARL